VCTFFFFCIYFLKHDSSTTQISCQTDFERPHAFTILLSILISTGHDNTEFKGLSEYIITYLKSCAYSYNKSKTKMSDVAKGVFFELR